MRESVCAWCTKLCMFFRHFMVSALVLCEVTLVVRLTMVFRRGAAKGDVLSAANSEHELLAKCSLQVNALVRKHPHVAG